jgi:hypothetical protein
MPVPKKKTLQEVLIEAGNEVLKEKKIYQPKNTLPEDQIKILLGEPEKIEKKSPDEKKELDSEGLFVE